MHLYLGEKCPCIVIERIFSNDSVYPPNNDLLAFIKDIEYGYVMHNVMNLSPYAIRNHRNDLALEFGGTAFHSRISEESAARILEGICDRTEDEERGK